MVPTRDGRDGRRSVCAESLSTSPPTRSIMRTIVALSLFAACLTFAPGTGADSTGKAGASASSVDAPADQPSPTAGCVPRCRTGHTCVQGHCVPACDPPCSADERCTAQGECEGAADPDAPDSPPLQTESAEAEQADPDLDQPRRTRFESVRMMATGIGLAALGVPLAGSGLMLMYIGGMNPCSPGESYCEPSNLPRVGTILLIVGGAMTVVGVPLIVVGSRRVPAPYARHSWAAPRPTAWIGFGPRSITLEATW
jgi:hypothetical protein